MDIIISSLEVLFLSIVFGVIGGVVCAAIVIIIALMGAYCILDKYTFADFSKKLLRPIKTKLTFKKQTDITTSAISYDNKEYRFTENCKKKAAAFMRADEFLLFFLFLYIFILL